MLCENSAPTIYAKLPIVPNYLLSLWDYAYFSTFEHVYFVSQSIWEYYSDDDSPMLSNDPKLKPLRVSKPEQYLNDPYCHEVCLEMHAKYNCVIAMQKWVEKMMDKNNSLGQLGHLSTLRKKVGI